MSPLFRSLIPQKLLQINGKFTILVKSEKESLKNNIQYRDKDEDRVLLYERVDRNKLS